MQWGSCTPSLMTSRVGGQILTPPQGAWELEWMTKSSEVGGAAHVVPNFTWSWATHSAYVSLSVITCEHSKSWLVKSWPWSSVSVSQSTSETWSGACIGSRFSSQPLLVALAGCTVGEMLLSSPSDTSVLALTFMPKLLLTFTFALALAVVRKECKALMTLAVETFDFEFLIGFFDLLVLPAILNYLVLSLKKTRYCWFVKYNSIRSYEKVW